MCSRPIPRIKFNDSMTTLIRLESLGMRLSLWLFDNTLLSEQCHKAQKAFANTVHPALITYPKHVVHGEGNLEAGVVRGFHGDGVRDEIRTKHQTDGDESTSLLRLTSWRRERERERMISFHTDPSTQHLHSLYTNITQTCTSKSAHSQLIKGEGSGVIRKLRKGTKVPKM